MVNITNKNFLSTGELAKLLGISRIAVYKKIKKGQIKAVKVGRNYVIERKDLAGVLDDKLSGQQKENIKKAVAKAMTQYGETFRLLGSA